MDNISFVRNGKEFEPTKNELKIVLNDYAKTNAELRKALELACRQLKDGNCAYCKYKDYQECPPNHNCNYGTVEYFLDKAKDMLKNDETRID